MNKELEALKAAMDAGNFDKARQLATAYVTAHPNEFTEYAALTDSAASDIEAIEAVVADVTHFRNQGRVESQYRAEAWHLHTWEPMVIGGNVGPQRRHPQATARKRVHN